MDVIGRKNRGVKTKLNRTVDYFGIIRQIKAPAVLLKYGFIDNAADVNLITDAVRQQTWAQASCKKKYYRGGIGLNWIAFITVLILTVIGAVFESELSIQLWKPLVINVNGSETDNFIVDSNYRVLAVEHIDFSNDVKLVITISINRKAN